MLELLSFGGTLIITYPGPKCEPHLQDTSPEKGYYRGIPMEEVLGFVLSLEPSWHIVITESHANIHDDIYLFFDGKGKKELG